MLNQLSAELISTNYIHTRYKIPINIKLLNILPFPAYFLLPFLVCANLETSIFTTPCDLFIRTEQESRLLTMKTSVRSAHV